MMGFWWLANHLQRWGSTLGGVGLGEARRLQRRRASLPPGARPYAEPVSIYVTALAFDGDDQPAPIVYRGSHVLPADDDQRGGAVLLCQIPGHISRDGRDDLNDPDGAVWPYLRLSVHTDGHAAAVLDRRQVEQLHTFLGEWLEHADRQAS